MTGSAAFCDFRFGTAEAKLTTAAPKLGLPAEIGLSWVLPRLVGLTAADVGVVVAGSARHVQRRGGAADDPDRRAADPAATWGLTAFDAGCGLLSIAALVGCWVSGSETVAITLTSVWLVTKAFWTGLLH